MPGKLDRTARTSWLAILLLTGMAGGLAAEESGRIEGRNIKKLSFGNLRKLTFKGGNGHYTLNNTELPPISSDAVELNTANRSFRVRATLLKTVLLSKSQPINTANQDLLREWAQEVPLIAHILTQKDSIGSMKPVVYDLLEPKGKKGLQLQEELVLLWSADPDDDSRIGDTELRPPMSFPGHVVDVQYRGIRDGSRQLVGKIILQILYIRDQGHPATLGAFVIVSKPSGDFEFYAVPRKLLDQIVISKENPRKPSDSSHVIVKPQIGQRPVLAAPNANPNQSAFREATMAAEEVTKKLLVYHTLYRLNLSFSSIVTRIRELHDAGVFNAHSTKLFQGYTQELQAEINQELLEIMHATELDDWNRFGKIREAEEKRIRDPDDVFIQAEERRRELQRKKQKKK
jgi:hypothetical protein